MELVGVQALLNISTVRISWKAGLGGDDDPQQVVLVIAPIVGVSNHAVVGAKLVKIVVFVLCVP